MENIEWLFFDMGSTLLDEEKSFEIRINRCVEAEKALGREVLFDDIYREMCNAAKEFRSRFYGALDVLGICSKIPYPAEFDIPYNDAVPTLEKLHKNYKIGIIANQPPLAMDRLIKFGMSKFVDVCVGSDDVGVAKPHKKIFEIALDKADCEAKNSVMIGDRLDNDIYPAKKLGFKTIWIKQGLAGKYQTVESKEYEPDKTILCLSQLLDIF